MATPMERFISKVRCVPCGGCWIWEASLTSAGYASFWSGNGPVLGHRWLWEQTHGPIPERLVVRHRCDVRSCVNPAHLLLGTVADNNWDMAERGRHGRPESRKTHCPRGHMYDEGNTYVHNGDRHCRTCRRERERVRYRKLTSHADQEAT